ncbi:Phage terminase large subunit [Rhodovastum atsumiense]|nr:Phage terminase large subunit [Rhodovastum atsumiense]
MLIHELELLFRSPGGRLMVFMPPGSGKSFYASRLFTPWMFAQAERLAVIGASNTSLLAEAFSIEVQGYLRAHANCLGVGAATHPAARWRTTNGGQYLAAGVGSAITGFRADVIVIDDPVTSREEADSATLREKAWQWWLNDVRTRLRPGGRVALVMTRWHEDDLAGRLLLHQPDDWRVVRLPALAEADDPLGRVPGAPLWGDDGYGYAAELKRVRAEYEASGDMRAWWALYQQEPRAPEGMLFKVERLQLLDMVPEGARVVRAWDLAATAEGAGRDPDWTVGVKLARLGDGRFAVLDVVRGRGGPDAVEAAILGTAGQDGQGVTVGLPQDPGQAGKWAAQYLVRRLAGFSVAVTPETGGKETRAGPLAAQVNAGNVVLQRAAWNRPLMEELRDFPSGRHDDQVDALSRAFGMLLTAPAPATVRPFRL